MRAEILPIEKTDLNLKGKKSISSKKENFDLFTSLLENILKSNPSNQKTDFLKIINNSFQLNQKEDTKEKEIPSKEHIEISLDELFEILNQTAIQNQKPIPKTKIEKIFQEKLPLNTNSKNMHLKNLPLEHFKKAKNLKELINIAKSYGIEIKTFKIDKSISKELSGPVKVIFEKIVTNQPQNENNKESNQIETIKTKEILISKMNINQKLPKKTVTKKEIKTKEIEEEKINKRSENLKTDLNQKPLSSLLSQKISTHKKENFINLHKNEVKNIKTDEPNDLSLENIKEIPKDSEEVKIENEKQEPISNHSTQNIQKHQTENKNISVQRTINDFAQKFKEAMESYKPPITKVQISLNPKNLGEVEVTLIHRGDNLHVSLNSQNTHAINVFHQNQSEFKNALTNLGFTSIDMSFSNQDQNKNQHQNQKEMKKEDKKEEIEKSAPITFIVPRYI